jgi:hypothetical protein
MVIKFSLEGYDIEKDQPEGPLWTKSTSLESYDRHKNQLGGPLRTKRLGWGIYSKKASEDAHYGQKLPNHYG